MNRRVYTPKNANLGSTLPPRRGRAGSLELDEEKRSAQHFLVRLGPPKSPPAANTQGKPTKPPPRHLEQLVKVHPPPSLQPAPWISQRGNNRSRRGEAIPTTFTRETGTSKMRSCSQSTRGRPTKPAPPHLEQLVKVDHLPSLTPDPWISQRGNARSRRG